MKIGICIILIALTLLAMLYIALQNNVDKKQKLRKQKENRVSSVLFFDVSYTSSRITVSAASPLRGPIFITRV